MTVAEFCEGRNISWHTYYYYWQRKIREYITQPRSTGTEFVQLPAPMEVLATANSGTITIYVGGMSVGVEGNVNKAFLKTMLNVL